jgi:hypothetical protein
LGEALQQMTALSGNIFGFQMRGYYMHSVSVVRLFSIVAASFCFHSVTAIAAPVKQAEFPTLLPETFQSCKTWIKQNTWTYLNDSDEVEEKHFGLPQGECVSSRDGKQLAAVNWQCSGGWVNKPQGGNFSICPGTTTCKTVEMKCTDINVAGQLPLKNGERCSMAFCLPLTTTSKSSSPLAAKE